MIWDGKERRKQAQDHDTLIEIVQILKNHVDNFDRHIEKFDKHTIDDDRNFKFLNRLAYGFCGAFFFFEVILKVVK